MSDLVNTVLAHIYPVYEVILTPFGSPAFGPKLATGLLALAVLVLIGFLSVSLPQAVSLRTALRAIRSGANRESEHTKRSLFQSAYPNIDRALLANKATSIAWQEFRKTLISRGEGSSAILLSSSRPHNFFNPRNLLIQYDFVRGLPNYFVGLGLLGTFIGLIAALTFSTQSLTTAVDQQQIKNALNQLLTTAAAKFYISATGLFASLVLSLFIKLVLKHLHGLVRQINDSLEERLLFVTEQTITEKQLSIQEASLQELRLFNTNIAMRIGDAVRSAVESSNESLTNKLSEIADHFAKIANSSGEGAGKAVTEAMKGAFDGSLKQASDAFGRIASELKDLPSRLSATAEAIQGAGRAAAQEQEQLAHKIKGAVETILQDAGTQLSAQMQTGTQGLLADLRQSGAVFDATTGKIAALINQLGASGTDYLKSLSSLSHQNSAFESHLSSLSSQISSTSDNLAKANAAIGDNIAKMLTGIEGLTRAASETGRTARDSQEAIKSAIETLQQHMMRHIQRFDAVDDKLATVFNSIISHLEIQSRQMGEQLTTMDQALARAVNQFESLIDSLIMVNRQAAE